MSVPASRQFDKQAAKLSLGRLDDLPAQRLVRPPRPVREIAQALSLLIPLLFLFLFVPWQQSATGTGQVVAWAPANRQQDIQAPIDGRIVSWHVREGERVETGDLLVELSDNDPDWIGRLRSQLEAASLSLDAAMMQVRSYETKLLAEQSSRNLVIAEYDARIATLRQRRIGDVAELETAKINDRRVTTLFDEGIVSSRDFELARLTLDKSRATVQARDKEIAATAGARDKAAADADAKIASVQAELEAARTKEADARQKMLDLEGKVSRQSTQEVRAPRDGVVLTLEGGPGGGQVKRGDLLVTIVPETTDRAVELYVHGNDMPFIDDNAEVRMLFEGWPALQFVGLPGGSTGTFGGRLAWIDAAGSDGKFRVVVVPDENEDAWPDPEHLRQGVRARGFVLLGRVSVGYELWRQINGFPPEQTIDKGSKPTLPSNKKPRAPSELQ